MALVWLIEDNAPFREATHTVLKAHKDRYTVRAFGTCEDALVALQKEPKPDVILLDVGLPKMNGIEGIKHFKDAAPDAAILIITVFEDDDKIFRAVCAGAAGYLLKSEPLETITVSIDQAIAGGSPMNPRIAKRVLSMFSSIAPERKEYGLTPREQSVLELLGAGLAKKQIADKLGVSTHTVGFFVRGIYKKLHVNCQVAAVTLAMREGLIKPQ